MRREKIFLNAAQARSQAKRLAAAKAVAPAVSFDAIMNIIERECDKAGRKWYGVLINGVPAMTATATEISKTAGSRKEARQMVLAVIDRFPLKENN